MFVYRLVVWFRNSMQYILGVLLYFFFFGSFNLELFILSIAGFLVSYNSVYYLNDIIDYKHDRKDVMKRKVKPLLNGRLTKKEAITYYFISLFLGVSLSFMVNKVFGVLIVSLLLLNILHSTLMKRLGMKAVASGMFVIQFIKYSLGWFAFTAVLDNFPLFIFSTFSFSYILFYVIYKKKLVFYKEDGNKSMKELMSSLSERILKKNRLLMIPLSLIAISYVLSMLFYPFKLQLLLMIPLLIFVSLAVGRMRFADHVIKLKAGEYITVFFMFGFILLFFLVQNPVGAQINESMNKSVNAAQQNMANSMPASVREGIDNINYMIYSDREKLENFLLNLTK